MKKMISDLFSDPLLLYNKMLDDIESAKKYVYLETYIYDDDAMGEKFRDALTKKCKQGVKVKLLIDSWGASVNRPFFQEFETAGGELRFFRKLRFEPRFFVNNHKRDHRKILLVDDEILFVGSSNITLDNINWRELTLRLNGTGSPISLFKKVFLENFEIHKPYLSDFKLKNMKKQIKVLSKDGFEVIRDIPSRRWLKIRDKYYRMIRDAKESVIIEMAYFIPDLKLRRAMKKAVKKGVEIKVILPLISDVRFADIMRNMYLGWLHRKGIKIYYYQPRVLHSKVIISDNTCFIGSCNLDYWSLVHLYEIGLVTSDKHIISQIKAHVKESLEDSKPFDYVEWKNRPLIQKIIEKTLKPFRKLI